MSKLPNPKEEEIYPLSTIFFENYLAEKDFTSKLMTTEHTVWESDPFILKVPKSKTLTKSQIEPLLQSCNLTIEDFEIHIQQLKSNNTFDKLIELSLRTPPTKK